MKVTLDASVKATKAVVGQGVRHLKEAVNRGLDRSVRLAVTGLSRSGKSTYITSVLHQLLHGVDSTNLPFFTPARERRLLGVRQVEHLNLDVAAFPYEASLTALADERRWPDSTRGLAEARLVLRYRPKAFLRKRLADTATLYLDIIDYPGEWLLDLPLLQLSYEDWCRESWQRFTREPRLSLLGEWGAAVQALDPAAPADDGVIRDLSAAYVEFLHRCKDTRHALSIIQPGRFLLPGDLAGTPVLSFFPLPPERLAEEGADKATRSYQSVLRERYAYYKEHVVKAFYRRHFASFDRQIVLVDCLSALNVGPECMRDMQEAVTLILKSFSYGKSGILTRLFSPKIDRVLFAATKADHVTPNQYHNLELFLRQLVTEARNEIQFQGVQTECLALASVRATEPAVAEFHGQKISCLRGIRDSDKTLVALFPGEVPTEIPAAADWHDRFNFTDFAPPSRDLRYGPIPHIRLDQSLEYLLGDKFG